MGTLKELQEEFAAQDEQAKLAAANKARLLTRATHGSLGEQAWNSLNALLHPAAKVRHVGDNGGTYNSNDTTRQGGSPPMPGAL